MLSRALKTPGGLPGRSSTAFTSALKVASPTKGTPVGSFNEDSLFECGEVAVASRFSAAGSVTNYDAPAAEAAEDPSPWCSEAFEDDEEDGEECPGGPTPALAVATTSKADMHEACHEASTKFHQTLGSHWDTHNHTTSAPTISATLASHQADSRRHTFKTALSAVTMGILEENETFTSPIPAPSFPSFPIPQLQPYCSSLPHNLSRCRSMPRPIAQNDGGSLTSATTMEGNSQRPSAHRTTFNGSPTSTEFRPPHEIAAASFSESPRCALQPSMSRHKSIADRLKSVVFEQTGHQPHSCGRGFLA